MPRAISHALKLRWPPDGRNLAPSELAAVLRQPLAVRRRRVNVGVRIIICGADRESP